MSKSNGNKPAFGRPACIDPHDGSLVSSAAEGLTKRELFAALALQGLAANGGYTWGCQEQYAANAVVLADALLKWLEEA